MGAHCHAGVPGATLLKQLPGVEASSVAFVRTGRCMGRFDGRPGRCDLLRTREARFYSASHWAAIGPPRLRMGVVCVRRSRERGLITRSVRRRAQARRWFSRLVARRDGGKRCGAPPSAERRAVDQDLLEGSKKTSPELEGVCLNSGRRGAQCWAGVWVGRAGGGEATRYATHYMVTTITWYRSTMTTQCQADCALTYSASDNYQLLTLATAN